MAAFAVVLGIAYVGSMIDCSHDNPLQEDIAPPSLTALERALDGLGYDHVYADYWIAYSLMFDTRERVTASPVAAMRNPDVATSVSSAPVAPYVVYAGDVYDLGFGPALQRARIDYERVVAGPYAIYVPDRQVGPERFDTLWQLDP